jgi:hypothetical protein
VEAVICLERIVGLVLTHCGQVVCGAFGLDDERLQLGDFIKQFSRHDEILDRRDGSLSPTKNHPTSAMLFDHPSARESHVVGSLRPMPLLGERIILDDQAEQEMHVAAVGSAFRRLGSMGSPHLAQAPYVPSDIRCRAASI